MNEAATMADDPARTAARIADLTARAQALLAAKFAAPGTASADPIGALSAWTEIWRAAAAEPQKLAQAQLELMRDGLALWGSFAGGGQPAEPVRDKRFADPAWDAPTFDFLRRAYSLLSKRVVDTVAGLSSLEGAMRDRAIFHARQFVDALSPANIPALNPQVLAAAGDSGGASLAKGLEHLVRDLEQGRMTMVDEAAFEVGRNVAATPGKVVFENRLFQLIQYSPATETVFATPLVIFPPWINKFYILDLTAEKSFIRWAVAEGLTVFVVSWANPDASFGDVTLDTYVQDGFLTAIDEVRRICGVPAVHAIGYCVAGTTLAAVLALLAARGQADKVATATFFTAQVDFDDAGELKLFIEDPQLETIAGMAAETGFLDGRAMATTFNMLRSNDLIWSYVVNNYLLGKDYAPFDLLYWNSDATNVPAKWHRAYLADLYRDNKLAKPGGISVLGTPIDLSAVKTPSYVQAGKDDHIAPARSVFKLTEHFTGPLRFVLAGSGHIAGVVNPPSSGKYQHWINDKPAPTLDAFVAGAEEHKGSWWPDWIAWLAPQSGDRVPARQPQNTIEDAPGRYVKVRI